MNFLLDFLKYLLEDITKIVISLEDSCLLIKGFSETIRNEAKWWKAGFLDKLAGLLGDSLLRNMLTGKGVNKVEDGIIRTGYGSNGSSKNKNF